MQRPQVSALTGVRLIMGSRGIPAARPVYAVTVRRDGAGATRRLTIGRYEVLRGWVGGGMARVYLARQPDLGAGGVKERASFGSGDPQLVQPLPARGAHLRLAERPEHRRRLRVVPRRGHAVHRDGVPRRGSLRPWVGGLSPEQGLSMLDGVLAGLAPRRSTASRTRPQAGEPAAHRGRARSRSPTSASRRRRRTTTQKLDRDRHDRRHAAYMAPEQALARTSRRRPTSTRSA